MPHRAHLCLSLIAYTTRSLCRLLCATFFDQCPEIDQTKTFPLQKQLVSLVSLQQTLSDMDRADKLHFTSGAVRDCEKAICFTERAAERRICTL